MKPMRRRADLSTPRGGAIRLGVGRGQRDSDNDAFGRFSESTARFLGTARFLAVQTVLVAAWILANSLEALRILRFDPYPFILLNLVFSTQAAYAAPLILLAQNRQDERDRASIEEDREVAARTQADAEFLGRELSSLRIAMSDVVTSDDLADAVERVGNALNRLERRLEALDGALALPAVPAALGAAGEEADEPHQGHDHGRNPEQVDGEAGGAEQDDQQSNQQDEPHDETS